MYHVTHEIQEFDHSEFCPPTPPTIQDMLHEIRSVFSFYCETKLRVNILIVVLDNLNQP